MIVDLIFPQPRDIASLVLPARLASTVPPRALLAIPAPGDPAAGTSQLDRISRLAALSHQDTVAGLLWLAMKFPAVCDAMLDKTEFDAIDDEEDYPFEEPEQFLRQMWRQRWDPRGLRRRLVSLLVGLRAGRQAGGKGRRARLGDRLAPGTPPRIRGRVSAGPPARSRLPSSAGHCGRPPLPPPPIP